MSRFRPLAFILLALVATTGVSQTKTPPAKRTKRLPSGRLLLPRPEKTLANGLKVIVVPTGFPNIVSLQIPVQTGSRNEVEPGKSGFAHFFEHMMFRGTKAYPADKYQEILTQVGARQNAYTTDDYTNYHTTFSKEDLETMLEVEADRFQNLAYSAEGFKTEARAVLGEYNKNSANPSSKLEEVQREKRLHDAHLQAHDDGLHQRHRGHAEPVRVLEDVLLSRWYRPEYTTVIVAGDVTSRPRSSGSSRSTGADWKRGKNDVVIPQEPPPNGPVYAHVPWTSPTLPWVTVAFHGPAFSDTKKDFAAIDMLFDLDFGETSDIHKKLVEQEQKVDQMFADSGGSQDPGLSTVYARVKKIEDAVYVRDEILKTLPAKAAAEPRRRRQARRREIERRYGVRARARQHGHDRGGARALRALRPVLRHVEPVLPGLRLADAGGPPGRGEEVLHGRAARRDDAFEGRDAGRDRRDPPCVARAPRRPPPEPRPRPIVRRPEDRAPAVERQAPLQGRLGARPEGQGRPRRARGRDDQRTPARRAMRIDEINKALFPMAGVVRRAGRQGDDDVHRRHPPRQLEAVLRHRPAACSSTPGLRDEDFQRLKDLQLNYLKQDLRSNNEEELGKEELQDEHLRRHALRAPGLGTVAGIEAITLDDVRGFIASAYTRAALTVGVAGDAPEEMIAALKKQIAKLPAGPALAAPQGIAGRRPGGIEVEIIEKDTRATAISFGHPDRRHARAPGLRGALPRAVVARRAPLVVSHLYQRIRETRGMNYGDYAYIEAFPRGMFQFFPDPNIARRAQIFEVWIRPVVPVNAHMALRIALHELQKLVENGMSQEDFERTRDYLMKNVFVMTATQNQQLGYALDSKWYGSDSEFTATCASQLAKLTLDDVNAAIRKHLSAKDLSVVIVTKDAKDLKARLVADEFSPIQYDADKPKELLDEDKVIGARKLNIKPENVRIVTVDDVFAK